MLFFVEWGFIDVCDMVCCDCNYFSIIFYSVGNEIYDMFKLELVKKMFVLFIEVYYCEDFMRLVM